MLSSLPANYLYLIAVVVSTVISLYTVRKIIFITRKRKIYDIPDNIRKIHGKEIPSLGGIGIFTGYMATAPFFVTTELKGWNYIIISSVLLFFTGVYDDIMNMRPSKKLLAQVLASFITVYFADLRINSFHGLFGLGEIPFLLSIGLTTFCCTFFINVFNFIDGIDGLACMASIFYTLIIGIGLAMHLHQYEAYLAFSLLGATLGLLYFNYPSAKIYMGDTGSMLSGFSIFILSLFFIHSTDKLQLHMPNGIDAGSAAMLVILALLFMPVFDALRVFLLRIIKGTSPLKADRMHLHYYLLDAGLSHAATAWLLIGVHIVTVAISIYCLASYYYPWQFLLAISIPSVATSIIASRFRKKKV